MVLERSALRQALADAIAKLNEQSQRLLHLYYVEDAKMSEIALEFGLTEARISQIHTQIIATLRARLRDELGDFAVLKPRKTRRSVRKAVHPVAQT